VNEFRPCGRRECRLCNPRPIHAEPHRETLAELFLATAAIVILGIAAFVLWPLVAS
jgi:hypothetical protein